MRARQNRAVAEPLGHRRQVHPGHQQVRPVRRPQKVHTRPFGFRDLQPFEEGPHGSGNRARLQRSSIRLSEDQIETRPIRQPKLTPKHILCFTMCLEGSNRRIRRHHDAGGPILCLRERQPSSGLREAAEHAP
jgi:hypothetical protein